MFDRLLQLGRTEKTNSPYEALSNHRVSLQRFEKLIAEVDQFLGAFDGWAQEISNTGIDMASASKVLALAKRVIAKLPDDVGPEALSDEDVIDVPQQQQERLGPTRMVSEIATVDFPGLDEHDQEHFQNKLLFLGLRGKVIEFTNAMTGYIERVQSKRLPVEQFVDPCLEAVLQACIVLMEMDKLLLEDAQHLSVSRKEMPSGLAGEVELSAVASLYTGMVRRIAQGKSRVEIVALSRKVVERHYKDDPEMQAQFLLLSYDNPLFTERARR